MGFTVCVLTHIDLSERSSHFLVIVYFLVLGISLDYFFFSIFFFIPNCSLSGDVSKKKKKKKNFCDFVYSLLLLTIKEK